MQFLTTTALLALASYIAADQSFTLTASGDGVNTPVTYNGQFLAINSGSAATFVLEEPSGYLKLGDQYVHVDSADPENKIVLGSLGQAAKDWGILDGHLRFGPTIQASDFWTCDGDAGAFISITQCDNNPVKLTLNIGGDAPAPDASSSATEPAPSSTSSEAPAPESTTSEAPASTSEAPESTSEAPAPVETSTVSSSAAPAPSSKATSEEDSTATVTASSFTTSTVCTQCTSHPAVTTPATANGANQVAVAGAAGLAAVAAMIL